MQFTAPANDLKVAKRQMGTIESIGQDGRPSLKMDEAEKSARSKPPPAAWIRPAVLSLPFTPRQLIRLGDCANLR
jgi:hypothetical protein